MKSKHRPQHENHPTTVQPTRCTQPTYGASPLVTNRSIPTVGDRTPVEYGMLGGPARWRWRKYALFPRGAVRGREMEDHWDFVKKPCPRKPEAQWPSR